MNNTDPTSFQSILAGVKRLREQQGSLEEEQGQKHGSKSVTPEQGQRGQVVVNAFNQGRQHYYRRGEQRTDDTGKTAEQTSTSASASTRQRQSHASSSRTVLVNTTQRENPLLDYLKNTSWRFVSSTSSTTSKPAYDYLVRNRSVLFLTLSYHKLYADYISRRMLRLRQNNDNILIFVIDGKEKAGGTEEAVNEITRLCMFNGFTLLVGFSFEQAAKYIEYLNE